MTSLRPLLLAGLFAALTVPGAAQAGARDSDHDGMPNSFEQRYKLKVHAKDASKDRDHDGLTNRSEYHAKTNPRKADSDGDGVRDGAEDLDDDGVSNRLEQRTGTDLRDDDSDDDGTEDGQEAAGTILSYTGGVLTIKRVDGATLSGTVDASTELECGDDHQAAPAPTATAARSGSEDDASDSEDDAGDSEDDAGHAEGSTTGDSGDSSDSSCTDAALAAGAPVHEAELEGTVFHSVHLA